MKEQLQVSFTREELCIIAQMMMDKTEYLHKRSKELNDPISEGAKWKYFTIYKKAITVLEDDAMEGVE